MIRPAVVALAALLAALAPASQAGDPCRENQELLDQARQALNEGKAARAAELAQLSKEKSKECAAWRKRRVGEVPSPQPLAAGTPLFRIPDAVLKTASALKDARSAIWGSEVARSAEVAEAVRAGRLSRVATIAWETPGLGGTVTGVGLVGLAGYGELREWERRVIQADNAAEVRLYMQRVHSQAEKLSAKPIEPTPDSTEMIRP
jgi:hypothetical protein